MESLSNKNSLSDAVLTEIVHALRDIILTLISKI